MSKLTKISLLTSVILMIIFLITQSDLVFDFIHYIDEGSYFTYAILLAFIPFLVVMSVEYIRRSRRTKEQEILMGISDMLIETYVSESVMLRVEKLSKIKGEENCQFEIDIMRSYIYDASDKISKIGKDLINTFHDSDFQKIAQMGLKRFTKQDPFNVIQSKRRISEKVINE